MYTLEALEAGSDHTGEGRLESAAKGPPDAAQVRWVQRPGLGAAEGGSSSGLRTADRPGATTRTAALGHLQRPPVPSADQVSTAPRSHRAQGLWGLVAGTVQRKQQLLVTEEAPEGLAGGRVAQEGSQGTVWLGSQRGDLRCAGNEMW